MNSELHLKIECEVRAFVSSAPNVPTWNENYSAYSYTIFLDFVELYSYKVQVDKYNLLFFYTKKIGTKTLIPIYKNLKKMENSSIT